MYRLVLIFFFSLPVQADQLDWQEQLNAEGVSILIRQEPGAAYKEFKASIELDATPAQAVALLQDNEACPEWVFRCKSSYVVEEVSRTERYFHQVTKLPFPAKSRDAVFHGQIEYGDDRSITINLKSAHDRLPVKKHVRIIETRGYYLIEPIEDNRIRLTWQFYVDPAGSLPAFLVNSMVTDLPFKSLVAFREMVSQRPYIDAQFIYDENEIPIDIMYEGSSQPGDS